MRILVFLVVALIAVSEVRAQNPPISATAASVTVVPGNTLNLSVVVGSPAAPVNNLFGISFVLTYQGNALTYVSSAPGAFIDGGTNPIFFPTPGSGNVAVGVSRITGGGVTGQGSVTEFQFSVPASAARGVNLVFGISDVAATDPNGNAINLQATPLTVQVISGVSAEAASDVPELGSLSVPFPNPAVGGASVTVGLPRAMPVRLVITDLLGRTLGAPVLQGVLSAGEHEVRLPLGDVPPGMYFVVLDAEGARQARSVIVPR